MTPPELVESASPVVGRVGSAFYFTPETLQVGKDLGLDGFRFYFAGRGGVLGDVEWPVVAAAFGYFGPGLVKKMWTSAGERVAPRDAARAYMACAQDFGRSHFAGVDGLDGFCHLAESVVSAADPAGLSLFAGVAAEPLAEDLPARAMQLTVTLRELRGSAHLVAVVASGLAPRMAHAIRRPENVATFGWDAASVGEPTDEDREKLRDADALTDRMMAKSWARVASRGAEVLAAAQAMEAGIPART